MSGTVRAVTFSLRRLMGADERLGTAYSGWLVQFGAAEWAPQALWRVVWFMGERALTRDIEVPWPDIAALGSDLTALCQRPLQVSAAFDTSDSWESVDLLIGLNGQPAHRVGIAIRSSGFEGPDADLLRRVLHTVEERAGLRPYTQPAWSD